LPTGTPTNASIATVSDLRDVMNKSLSHLEQHPEKYNATTLLRLVSHAAQLDLACQSLEAALVQRLQRLSLLGFE